MIKPVIRRADPEDEKVGMFIARGFAEYSQKSDVVLDYEEFCFTAENEEGEIIGVVTGKAYYDEVHVDDLIIDENYRRKGIGRELIRTIEDAYRDKGYSFITLSTFGFQAPDFYKKLGYQIEFIRENKDPRLNKIFMKKEY